MPSEKAELDNFIIKSHQKTFGNTIEINTKSGKKLLASLQIPTVARMSASPSSSSPRSEGLLEQGLWEEAAFEKSSWQGKGDWKPATPPRSAIRSALSFFTSLLWRVLSIFLPKAGAGELRKTAWLDGLRGFAAFLVYWHHHELWAHGPAKQDYIFENEYGHKGEYHLASFYGMRLFFGGGHIAVATFFVISGYVLSVKPLSLIHNGEQAKLADNLGSALFRRWFRLFIPLIVTTFLYMCSWHAFGLWVNATIPERTWWDELWKWYIEIKAFSFIFKQGGLPWLSYNFHLWSIPVEFKGSIIVYTSLLAFSKLSRNARLLAQMGLMWYFMYIVDGWYGAAFMLGMFLCDLDQLAEIGDLPRFLKLLAPYKEFIYYHLLVFALFIVGIPVGSMDIADVRQARGWYYLSFLKPEAAFDYKWFYLFWAAGFIVAATPRIGWLRRFCESRFCQYLGRISFALYLVHGPVLWILGDRLYTAVGFHGEEQLINLHGWANKIPIPQVGPVGMELSFLAPHLVLLPVTFWAAEIVTRLIDDPSVKFAQSLYRRMLLTKPAIKM